MTKAFEGSRDRIVEVVRYFFRLGLLGFGGPVALVGQMGRELADERGWLTKDEMREAVAICQSLPGPLAIQVGIYIAYLRAGFWGAWAGGWAFILPNFVMVAILGGLYVHFGGLSWITAIFYGVGHRDRRRDACRGLGLRGGAGGGRRRAGDLGPADAVLPQGRQPDLRQRS